MSKRPPDQLPALNEFDTRFLKKGKHSAVLCLPLPYHALIGRVVAHWGTFETVFNAMLKGLVEGEAEAGGTRNTTGWEGSEFRRRRELFKDICKEWLSAKHPDEAKHLSKICDTAGHLRWRRDMIAHGVYGYTVLPHSMVATACHAINERTGDKMPFDEHSLKKLYHDISHLTADLVITVKGFAEVEGQFLAVSDTELLRVARESSRLSRATRDKSQSPPQSSEA